MSKVTLGSSQVVLSPWGLEGGVCWGVSIWYPTEKLVEFADL